MQNQKNNTPSVKSSKDQKDLEAGNKTAGKPEAEAHKQAEKDIDNDLEISAHSPNDDLDEGELARLGEDNNPIE